MWGGGEVLPGSRSLSGDKAHRGEPFPWLLLRVCNCLVYSWLYFYLQTVHVFGSPLNSCFLRILPPAPLRAHLCTVTCLGHHTPLPSLQHPSLCSLHPSQPLPSSPGSPPPLPNLRACVLPAQGLSFSTPHFSSSAGTLNLSAFSHPARLSSA